MHTCSHDCCGLTVLGRKFPYTSLPHVMSDALRHHIVPLSGSRQLATARHASRVYPAVRNELGVYIRLKLYDKFQDEEEILCLS